MKAIIILVFALLLSGSKSFSKGYIPGGIDEGNSVTVNVSEYNSVDTIIVPTNIRTSFITKYPKATQIMWYRYTPDMTSVEKDVWYSVLDTSDYYVSFLMDDGEYVAWYDNGTWIRTSRAIENSELPAAVLKAINSEYAGFIITDVDLENDRSQTLYEVDLEKGDKKFVVHYTPTGTVFKKKERNISKADPQETMVTDFETRYPNATSVTWYTYAPRERVEILPDDWDYTMGADDYEVRFNWDGTDYVAWYDNGKWLRSEATTFDKNKLPAKVNSAISSQYAGYIIKDVDREDNINQVLYEVELEKGTDRCKIHYSADGNIVKKKCRDGSKMKVKG